ncbi:MAG: hypothetical protein ABFD89_26315, partial [Bryobacteraceae bacterium]
MTILHGLVLLAAIESTPPPLSGTQIVERMMEADNVRLAKLAGYTGLRRYRLENKRFNKRAEMTVRVACAANGAKTFEVVEEKGSGFVRRHVIRKMIDAEQETSRKGERESSRIIPKNYEFRLVGMDQAEGRPSYVLGIIPRTKNKFLIRGRIWVDAEDYAIARIEGSPAQNPSFWTRRIDVHHRYSRVGPFWLPAVNRSRAEVRVFGTTEVT